MPKNINPILNLKKKIEESNFRSSENQNIAKSEIKSEEDSQSGSINQSSFSEDKNLNSNNQEIDSSNFILNQNSKNIEEERDERKFFKKERDESELPPKPILENGISPFKVSSQEGKINFDILEAIKRIKEDAIRKQKEYLSLSENIKLSGNASSNIVSENFRKKKKSKILLFFGNVIQLITIFLITFSITFISVQYKLLFENLSFLMNKDEYKKEEEKLLVKLDEKDDIISKGRAGEFNFDSPAIASDNEDLSRNRIVIPAINVDAPIIIVEKNTDSALREGLRKGVVHYPGTSFFGENGNVFLTGHSSNYAWEKGNYNYVFANLGKLKNGDKIIVYFNQKKYVYKVSKKFEIWPKETYVLNPNPKDRNAEPVPLLTLMTCTPAGTNLKRLIIWADEDPDYMTLTDEGVGNSSGEIDVNKLPELI